MRSLLPTRVLVTSDLAQTTWRSCVMHSYTCKPHASGRESHPTPPTVRTVKYNVLLCFLEPSAAAPYVFSRQLFTELVYFQDHVAKICRLKKNQKPTNQVLFLFWGSKGPKFNSEFTFRQKDVHTITCSRAFIFSVCTPPISILKMTECSKPVFLLSRKKHAF